ncbi:MAG: beta-propeller domain-containing protein [Candidatus Accumulibacter sp.]|nr:beta-propeller domain-containing protein [Accumulibacter sp.]
MFRMLKSRLPLSALFAGWLFLAGGAQLNAGEAIPSDAGNSLRAFASEDELNAWVQKKKSMWEAFRSLVFEREQSEQSSPAAAPIQNNQESVTNTQTEGVDEGGIVKVHDKHLVILRRGRLFTVRIGDGALQPVDMIDAFPPGAGENAWYDEMLISGDTVVVIGYSYGSGGTEINLFGIDAAGRLSYQSTYVLRSNDYYSSRNYASRLIGNRLILYTPLFFNFHRPVADNLPAMWRWRGKGQVQTEFKRIAPATRIYRTDDDTDSWYMALHTIEVCEIGDGELDCSASAVFGPAGREFYVARDAVYVWTARYMRSNQAPVPASVFRLPLDLEQPPAALKAFGSPIDQFSFLESADGHLNVLLRAEGPKPSMWASEWGSRNLALLRVPLGAFGDGAGSAPREAYHPLPAPGAANAHRPLYRPLQNRYVGDYLVYGVGQTWNRGNAAAPEPAYLLDWKRPEAITKINLPHSVDRIEALGKAPLLVGAKGRDLYLSALAVEEGPALEARLVDSFRMVNAAQGETRSHGFFYKPDAQNGESGLLGLPFVGAGVSGRRQLRTPSSGVVFLRNDYLKLAGLGTLNASRKVNTNDGCKASCVDWYGNSRPLFVGGRIFALMGYEIVEGALADGGITEARRVDILRARAQR